MRFHATLNVDVAKWSQVKMERENNMKDFKADEEMPKFGAGSEYGREAREEARRKKFGVTLKKYNPEDQPWLLKLGGKAGKKYRGLREGGVSENASYYVFVKATDGAFEAYPVEEWYNFSAVQRYKTLNAEEAEEEFGRRDKVLNYFSIMLRKRLKNEDDGEKDPEEAEKPKKKSSKYGTGSSDLKISDMDEWIHSSEEESEEDGVAEDTADSKSKDKKKKGPDKKKSKKKKKKGSDDDEDEPLEDSDDGDGEGREVDYISDEESSEEEVVEDKTKNDLKGVEDEDAMRKMDDSESEEEKEEEKKETPEETPGETPPAKAAKGKKDNKKTASSSDSSSDTSDSDDFDSDANFQSPMFMQSSKKKKDGSRPSSRANTPTKPLDGSKKSRSHKRKAAAAAEEGGPQPKRSKSQPSSASNSQQSTSSASRPSPSPYADLSNDGITEDAVRRYLTRKPMTTTELLHKFKSKKTGLSREQMVNTIAQILKRLDPEKQMVKGKMYLSIK